MLYCIIPYTWNAKLCHYIYNKLDLYIIFYFHFTFELGFMREKVIQLDIYSVPDRHAIGPPTRHAKNAPYKPPPKPLPGTPKSHPSRHANRRIQIWPTNPDMALYLAPHIWSHWRRPGIQIWPSISDMAHESRYGPLFQIWLMNPDTALYTATIYAAIIGALLRPLLDPGSRIEVTHLATGWIAVDP